MRWIFSLWIGKTVRAIMQARGGGSALPGLVVERLCPNFAAKPLDNLPYGVALISGTNGKTTTTKIVTELLESQGLRVFTNKSGSNFMRGVISELLGGLSVFGKPAYDVAVLELDEAHAVPFVGVVAPHHTLLLNIFPDQVDRFKDTKDVARLLFSVAKKTSKSLTVNREDPLLRQVVKVMPKRFPLQYFGASDAVRPQLGLKSTKTANSLAADVLLTDYKATRAGFTIDDAPHKTQLRLPGAHNALNAAAAVSFVRAILDSDDETETLMQALSHIQPAAGRGEVFMIQGKPLELILVKNLTGLQLSLDMYTHQKTSTMIAMNNAFADGQDTSWLQEVNFSGLAASGVAYVSGTETDLLSRTLKNSQVTVSHSNPDVIVALNRFLSLHTKQPKRIYCSYTAMREIREELINRTA